MPATDPDTSDLIACPVCDVLYRETDVELNEVARCRRCKTVLASPRAGAMTRITMLAIAALVLMVAAVSFPFLELSVLGLHQRSSVIDAILTFSGGLTAPLSFALALLIVLLPATRLAALIYALAPMALGWHPARYAMAAYRWAEQMRPWAMAEIFIIGVAVALVKVAGMATVGLGPAFWAFCVLVLITVLKDNLMCRLSVWKTLSARSAS